MSTKETSCNYIGGVWQKSRAEKILPVLKPATAAALGQVPHSPGAEIDQAVRPAASAFEDWRRMPATDRIQYLFRLKDSFFGTLHGQGRQAVEYFIQTKVVVDRWPDDWSRQFKFPGL